MSEAQGWLFEPEFNRSVKVVATDDRITSDSGLLLLRGADHRLGMTEAFAQNVHDPRRQESDSLSGRRTAARADLCAGPGVLGARRFRPSGS